jgi:hypothetical protein
MERKLDVSLLLIGMLALTASAAVDRLVSPHHPTALLQGFLDGVSITTIFGHLIRYRIRRLGRGEFPEQPY